MRVQPLFLLLLTSGLWSAGFSRSLNGGGSGGGHNNGGGRNVGRTHTNIHSTGSRGGGSGIGSNIISGTALVFVAIGGLTTWIIACACCVCRPMLSSEHASTEATIRRS